MPNGSERHAQHDHLLVAALAAGDLAGVARDGATSLVARCAECRSLHDDLIAIARATAVLPAAVRPRDFQISPEQAVRLRPGGWRRLVAAFASPRFAMTRQLGVGLATLGVAGLMISALPSFSLGMAGSAGASAAPEYVTLDSSEPARRSPALVAEPAASPAASGAAAASAPSVPSAGGETLQGNGSLTPLASQGDRSSASSDTSGGGFTAVGEGTSREDGGGGAAEGGGAIESRAPGDAGTGSLLPVVSAILLVAGLALLLARRIARRLSAA